MIKAEWLLSEEELEDKLKLIFKADIGCNGRRLTKHKTKYGELTECVTCNEPTPVEYARELSYAAVSKAAPLIAQSERERIIDLFKIHIPCIPDLYGHGCDQEHNGCDRCKHITDIVDGVRQSLGEKGE